MSFIELMIRSPFSMVILIITVLTSITGFNNPEIKARLLMRPYSVKRYGEWYRILSCGLVHGGWMHLGFNMITFYFFALSAGMEVALGTLEFAILYIGSLIFSAIPSMLRHRDNPLYQSLGASGAISGVVLAFIMVNPTADLFLFFIPYPIPAWFLGLAYIAFSFVASLRSTSIIAHDAHLFGALGGVILLVLMKPQVAEFFIGWVQRSI